MNNDQEPGNPEEDDDFLTELYLRLEERAVTRYADSYDVDAAAARYRQWLTPRTDAPETVLVDPWGRVDANGTVYVRTPNGERAIGSRQGRSPEEALAYFRRSFQMLEAEVTLIEQRIADAAVSPADGKAIVRKLLASVATANALGDLEGLHSRLETLELTPGRRSESPTSYERLSAHRNDHRAMNFLGSLAPAEREAFTAVAMEETFPRGSRLMTEGEQANYVMVILSGWTRITVRGNGGERVVAERGPGQLVGERAALRRNVRSATVTALTEVSVLVMKTEDFASFISAHSRVLDIVENQIYDRLTENPAGYAQDGWPGTLMRGTVNRALRARLQPDLAGENCTVLLTDVVGFGALHRSDHDRRIIRREGLEMMQASLGSLWDECISQDRGDGLLIVAPPPIPTARIIECVNGELPRRLRLHNRTYSASARINLRIAAHVGPIIGDLLGVSGETIIRTARTAEAPVLKEAMAETGTGLGIIVSEFVHEIAIAHATGFIDAAEYKKVAVSNKEFTGSAWMRLVDVSPLVREPPMS